jgi:membrane protein implicated in regulation of membrane protease activity
MNSLAAVAGVIAAIWLLRYVFVTLEETLLGFAILAVVALALVFVYAAAHEDTEKRKGDYLDE